MDTALIQESARALPLPDRLELLLRLWDEFLEEGWEPGLSAETKAELDRRWAQYHANPASGLTWDQVVDHVRRPR